MIDGGVINMQWLLSASLCLAGIVLAAPVSCETTDVIVLGAGSAGISTAKALSSNGINNFIILEYNEDVGGRVRHTNFGQRPDGRGPYVIELGANWIHGIGEDGGPRNPIYEFAMQDELEISAYAEKNATGIRDNGSVFNLSRLSGEFQKAFEEASVPKFPNEANGTKDISARAALRRAGWNPAGNPEAQAAEVYGFDFSYAVSPDVFTTFGGHNETRTGPYYGGPDVFVRDQRGYNFVLKQQLGTFLKEGDRRLRLNTIVSEITASSDSDSVTVRTKDGQCFHAKHAVSTFSVGVLQNAALPPYKAPVRFEPSLPEWKQDAISGFGMGVYTKIFFQFDPDEIFWPLDIENIIYASPIQRAYYNTWQSLTLDHYFPGSGLMFATMYTQDAQKIESQTDEETKQEALEVLRRMFGEENVPEPVDFMYPRWGQQEWAYGSYSSWPVGYTVAQHENLRANVGRLWFAGEAFASQYQSTVHGAWLVGKEVGERVAGCLHGNQTSCGGWKPAFTESIPHSDL